MLPLVFRFPAFSAALVYSDIAAVCCDSRIVRWQDGIAPYTISVRLAALAASLNCCVGDSFSHRIHGDTLGAGAVAFVGHMVRPGREQKQPPCSDGLDKASWWLILRNVSCSQLFLNT